jgi:hypothetical protein
MRTLALVLAAALTGVARADPETLRGGPVAMREPRSRRDKLPRGRARIR